jgi:hypothetical protein
MPDLSPTSNGCSSWLSNSIRDTLWFRRSSWYLFGLVVTGTPALDLRLMDWWLRRRGVAADEAAATWTAFS